LANPKQLKNFVTHSLSVAALSTDLTLTWDSVAGWPTVGDFMIRLDNPALSLTELYLVTSVNVGANQTTGVRAQEGTGASAFPINSTGGNDLTAQMMADAFVRLDTAASQTLTGPLVVPPAIGSSAAATSYGSMPVKIAEFLLAALSADIAFTSIPAGGRHLKGDWYARGDSAVLSLALNMRLNGVSTATYESQSMQGSAAAVTAAELLTQTSIKIADIPGATATAAYFGQGDWRIKHYAGTVGNKVVTSNLTYAIGNLTTNMANAQMGGISRTTGVATTQVDILPASGNLIVGSLFTLWLEP
jgi:hypothetical protein